MLTDRLQCGLCPALEPREALLAGLEDAVADQPGAQVRDRLPDFVLIERLVRDRQLAAEHPTEDRRGGRAPQPLDDRPRLGMPLERSQQRLKPRERTLVCIVAQLAEEVSELAARTPLDPEAATGRAAPLAVFDRGGAAAASTDRLAIDPGGGAPPPTAAPTHMPPLPRGPPARKTLRTAVGQRRDLPALLTV